MKRFKLIPHIALLIIGTIAMVSTVGADESTVMRINGEDVAQPTDTVIASFSYGSDLQGSLLDSGINFVLITNREGGAADTLTVFDADDVVTICGWEGDLLKGIAFRINGNTVYCSE